MSKHFPPASKPIVALLIGVLGALLLTYQNCSSSFVAGEIAAEAASTVCTPIKESFSGDKIADEVLHIDENSNPDVIAKGAPLMAIIDNVCRKDHNPSSAVNSWIPDSESADPLLRYQAYSLSPDRDYSATELHQIVDSDSCVLAIRVNRALEFNSLPTDPLVPRQKVDLDAMQAAEAYDILYGTGEPTTKAVVGVIDSGARYYDPSYRAALDNRYIEIWESHPDLVNIFWHNDSGGIGYNI